MTAFVALWAAPIGAALLSEADQRRMAQADIVVLGEIHDNPDHHAVQAELVASLAPRAVIYEMLSAEQAARVTPTRVQDSDVLAAVLDWGTSGWPDFSMYYPIFAASLGARVFGGAVPRARARLAAEQGIAETFGPDADLYGLTDALDPEQQALREQLQAVAHCDALPAEMLPVMVSIQRLRDAELARVTITAVNETGGPVVLITGNGHARRDWGVPALLARVRPDLRVFALGQSERDDPGGGFDAVLDSPPPPRDDPCAVFRDAG